MIKQIQILNSLISSTLHSVKVNTITSDGDNWVLDVDNTFYITISTTLTIESLDYKVVSFELNESLTIKAVNHTTAPTATSFTIPPPTFRHGTAQLVNAEHTATDFNDGNKYPFIWLVELNSISHKGGYDSLIDSVMDATLMFFTDNDQDNWLIEDHYINAIYPMLNEIEFFITSINNRPDLFSEDFDYKTTNHINFGDYLLSRGNQERIISDNISGVELKMDLSYLKSNCTSGVKTPCAPVTTSINNISYSSVSSGGLQNIIIKYQSGTEVTYTVNEDNEVIIPNGAPSDIGELIITE